MAQRMIEPLDFDFTQLKRAAWYLVGKPKAALRFRRQTHVDKITVLVDRFCWRIQSRGRARRDWWLRSVTTLKSGSTLQSLTVLSVGGGVLRSGERRSSWTFLEIYVPRSDSALLAPLGPYRTIGPTSVVFLSPLALNDFGKGTNIAPFSIPRQPLGLRSSDQSCHHETWLLLHFVD